MNILVTGAKGFIGRNLIAELKNKGFENIFEVDRSTDKEVLKKYSKRADFIFHLAGINRPIQESEYMEGNYGFTSDLIDSLQEANSSCPVLFSSSIHASFDNPYGESKKAAEQAILEYHQKSKANIFIMRLPNVFGKWCRPNYNSAVATFCHNIARDLPIEVNDPNTLINLIYIDDLINEMISFLEESTTKIYYCDFPYAHQARLSEIVGLIKSFRKSRDLAKVPDLTSDLSKKLYSTYLSYLPTDNFNYPLKMNRDHRGSFTEFLKTPNSGQISVNISKPGITKGNHWHHSKNEKFLVVSGSGVIRLREIDSDEIHSYYVNGENLEVVDIPVGYTHNIENLGEAELVTVMWANEVFDPKKPDTYYMEV